MADSENEYPYGKDEDDEYGRYPPLSLQSLQKPRKDEDEEYGRYPPLSLQSLQKPRKDEDKYPYDEDEYVYPYEKEDEEYFAEYGRYPLLSSQSLQKTNASRSQFKNPYNDFYFNKMDIEQVILMGKFEDLFNSRDQESHSYNYDGYGDDYHDEYNYDNNPEPDRFDKEEDIIMDESQIEELSQTPSYNNKKLTLFHIYDGYLSAKYGASIDIPNSFIKNINPRSNFKVLNKTQISEDANGNFKNFKEYVQTVYLLSKYLNSPDNDSTYLFFGPPTHATALYFIKTNDYIKAYYINTGEGLDKEQLIGSYYESGQYIYLPRNKELLNSFIQYLKPFIFYRYVSSCSNKMFRFMMNTVFIKQDDIYILSKYKQGIQERIEEFKEPSYMKLFNSYESLMEFYSYFDKTIMNSGGIKIYYELLNELFSRTTLEKITKIFNKDIAKGNNFKTSVSINITATENNIDNILKIWNDFKFTESDKQLNNYITTALSSFKIKSHNKKLLFEIQKSGTCTYKSCLVAWFIHMMETNIPSMIPLYYKALTIKLYTILQGFISESRYIYSINMNSPNPALIYNKLVEDKIVSQSLSYYNIMKTYNKLVDSQHSSETFFNLTIDVFTVPFELNKRFINDIRSKKNILMEIVKAYEGLDKKEHYMVHAKYEFALLSMLWECYFHREKWEEKFKSIIEDFKLINFNKNIILLFTNMPIRYELTVDEIKFIVMMNYYHNINSINIFSFKNSTPQFIKMRNECELWKYYSIKYTYYNKYDSSTQYDPLIIYHYNNDLYISLKKINNPYYVTTRGSSEDTSTFIINYIVDKTHGEFNIFNIHNLNNLLPHITQKLKDCGTNSDMISINNEWDVNALYNVYLTFYHLFDINERYKIVYNIIKKINENNITISNEYTILGLLNTIGDMYYMVEFGGCSSIQPHSHMFYPEQLRNYFYFDYSNIPDNKKTLIQYNKEILKNIFNIYEQLKPYTEYNKDIINRLFLNMNKKITSDLVKVNNLDNTINFTYNNENITEKIISRYDNQSLLLSYFIIPNRSEVYHTENYIIVIQDKTLYESHSFEKNLLFIFRKKIISENSMIDTDNIMINNAMYSFTNNVNKYPFLINAPHNSLNFVNVNVNNNKFKFISFFYENIVNHHLLKNAVYEADNTRYYYGEFIIKSNHITPYYNMYNIDFLNKVRQEKYGEFLYKKVILNNDDINNITNNLEYNQTDFDKLDGLFNQGKETINDVLRNILINKTPSMDSKLKFIKWLNKDAKNFIERINNTQCKTNCDDKPQVEVIERIIKGFDILRKRLIERINYNNSTINSLFTFINSNYRILSLLLQTNSMIDSLLALKKIINKCTKLSCHDIYEIAELFNKRENNLTIIEGMVEIIFGRVLRQEQIDKVREILNDYKTKTRRVHQFMMAKGKSSVITPILAYTFISMKKNVYIIVPEHLIKQTQITYIDYSQLFGVNPNIMSDATLKQLFLENKYDKQGIYLFDEFDSMYNPLQSNFNIINNTPEQIDMKLVDMIYDITIKSITSDKPLNDKQYSLEKDIFDIVKSQQHIKNVTYGMSVINGTKNRICIPFNRQDSPNEGSNFSSYILSLVLTIMYYYNDENFIIDENDIIYIDSINKRLINKILAERNIPDIDYKNMSLKDKIKILRKISPIIISPKLFQEYFHLICINFGIADNILNCSFIDIISMDCEWQVGYSGTTNINLNIPTLDENPYRKYNTEIIKDIDSNNVDIAMLTHNTIIKFPDNNKLEMLKNIMLMNFDVIIDACAIFKDYSNEEIAEILYKLKNRPVKYLTKTDVLMVYNGEHIYDMPVEDPLFYFSQRHIVGIDIMNQPTSLQGIVMVNDNNTYTQVAQAIYRMRKLNKGQTCMFGYVGNEKSVDSTYNTSEDIRKMLLHNEDLYVKNHEPLLYLQYMKYYVRSIIKNNHKETSLHTLYEDMELHPTLSLRELCMMKLNKNIFKNDLDKIKSILGKPFIDTYEYIISKNDYELITLLYQTNTSNVNLQKNIEKQRETEKDEDIEIERFKQLFNDKTLNKINEYNILKTYFEYNHNKPFEESLLFNPNIINNDKYTIILSTNLIITNSYRNEKYLIILVFINDTTIIIDSCSNINSYIHILPIYNTSGRLLNKLTFPDKLNNINIDNILNFKVNNSMNPSEEYDFAFVFNVSNDIINTITLDQEKFDMMMPIYTSITLATTPINKFKPFITSRFNDVLKKYKLWVNNALRGAIHLLYLEYIRSYYELDNENKSMYNPQYIKLTTPKKLELSEIINEYIEYPRFEVYVKFQFQLLSYIFFNNDYIQYLKYPSRD